MDKSSRPNQDVNKTMSRLRRSVRLKAFFSNKEAEEEDNNYIPKLHVPSKWLPPNASKDVEKRLDAFEERLNKLKDWSTCQKPCSNLSPRQWALLKQLREDDTFMVISTDKNLGPAIIERATYIKRAWSDHLGDDETYLPIEPKRKNATLAETKY